MPCKINSVQCDFLPLANPGLEVSSLRVQGWVWGSGSPGGAVLSISQQSLGLLLLPGECQQEGTQHSLHGTNIRFSNIPFFCVNA